MRFEGHEFYFKSYEEMLRMLPDDAAALDETVRVAEKCNFDFTLGHNYMPNFDTPPGLDHKAYLRSHGIRTRTRRKLSEGSTEIIDALRQGHVSYVINTIDINQHNTRLDGYEIRRTAVENNVTVFTALETVKVLLDVLEEITFGVSTIDAK